MLRGLRQETVLLVGLAIPLLILWFFFDEMGWLPALGLSLYLLWHLVNLFRLKEWIRRGTFRPPLSYGIWELVFDDLQRRKLNDRKRKRALLRFLGQLRDAASSLPDAAVVLDDKDRVRWFNRAARKYLGLQWPRDSVRPITEIVSHPILKEFLIRADFSRVLELPSPVNGAWMLDLQVVPFRETRQRLLVARDITQAHTLEQTRRDFVAGVSHELRTPLTVFQGYLEPLVDAADEFPDWADVITQLGLQSDRMQRLVEDLLTLSRLELTEQLRADNPIDFPDLIRQVVGEAEVLSGTSAHEITLHADDDIWVRGNEADLRSVVANLVFNAVRHTDAGSRIRIEWQISPDGAVLSVADDGKGIASYHLPRLTERFYRADSSRARNRGGTGLGLAIVKHALNAYDAELRIDSNPGRGSTFYCEFPSNSIILVGRKSGRTYRA